MRDSAALRVSIALGAFVLLQGADGCPGAEPPPEKPRCVGDVQTLSLAPGEVANLLRCSSKYPDEAYYDGTTYEFVGITSEKFEYLGVVSDVGASLKVQPFNAGDFFSIAPSLEAPVGQVVRVSYEFKHRATGASETARIEATVIDFYVDIVPVAVMQQVGDTLIVEEGSNAALHAVVFGPAEEPHQYAWRVEDALDAHDAPAHVRETAEMLSLGSLNEGRYTLSVGVTGIMLGDREATADVVVVEGAAAVLLADESCSSPAFADPHFDLDCAAKGTSYRKVCARFEVFLANGGEVASVVQNITEADVRSTADGIAFCKNSGTDAVISGYTTVHRTDGTNFDEPFSRIFH